MRPLRPVKRDGYWYLIRRVPRKYAGFDSRTFVKLTTNIRITDDPQAVHAMRLVHRMNLDVEEEWRAKAAGETPKARQRYDDAVLDANGMGFTYQTVAELVRQAVEQQSLEEIARRVEALIGRRFVDVPEAVTAVLGGEDRPLLMVSDLADQYEDLQSALLAQMSPDQQRRWKNQRKRALVEFQAAIGDDIAIVRLTVAEGVKFRKHWQDRITDDELDIGTANKSIGTVSKMLRLVSKANEITVPAIFSGLRIEGGSTQNRPPFEIDFIRDKILAPHAMDDLNEEARRVVYIMVETGLRPSEIVNLSENTILVSHNVPHVVIKPEGRVLKTKESWRKMPLVGVALEAMRLQPKGFPRYFDKGSTLSANVNQYFENHDLKPTEEHTLYSLRHSFEDRVTALGDVPDKIQAYLMGHKYSRPKYGKEPPLDQLQSVLNRIAFESWPTVL